ncbi:GNAT family N-acetyltransferase [Streptomyces sp. SDr-06]|uniref:peptidogalycan biosysnthesis protein n=1 Tax=Streptomyces sp. SDr-06 TaxID=2267702 RepID=UPI000DEBB2B1|nr:GNAT family N-acetyltransferase [Streptomyces sp. SDr-06]RCH64202.1 GNAT family N-acetyltransferase [Streptomyces sp. SDr-06]
MDVRPYDAVSDLPVQDWDSLTLGSTIYSTAGFQAVRQEELPDGARGRRFIAYDAAGVATSGLEAYTFAAPPHGLYTPADLLQGLISQERHTHLASRPLAIGAGWSEFRGQFVHRPEATPEQRAAALEGLAAEMLGFAKEAEASVLAYYYLPREDALDIARAHGCDDTVVLYHDVETLLPIGQWRDLDEYYAWLPAGRRPRARREVRNFKASGRTIREVPLPEVVDTIAPLNSALMRKHGHAYGVEKAREVYGRQGRHLGDVSTLLLNEDEGRPVGFALRYRQRDMLWARVAGFDYSFPNMADYFNLVFYHPIAQGVGLSTRAIHLGLGTFQAKLARGAQPNPLYTVLVGVDQPLMADADAVRGRNRTEAEAFGAEYGQYVVGGLNTEDWLL